MGPTGESDSSPFPPWADATGFREVTRVLPATSAHGRSLVIVSVCVMSSIPGARCLIKTPSSRDLNLFKAGTV